MNNTINNKQNGLSIGYSSVTLRNSPRTNDLELENANPFVDKAGIFKHKSRVQELDAKSQYFA